MNIKTDIDLENYDPAIGCKAHLITCDMQKNSLDICLVALSDFRDPSRIHMNTTSGTFKRWRSTLTAGSILRLIDGSLHKVNEVQLINGGKKGARLFCSPISRDDLNENQKKALFALDLDYDYFNVSKQVSAEGMIHV